MQADRAVSTLLKLHTFSFFFLYDIHKAVIQRFKLQILIVVRPSYFVMVIGFNDLNEVSHVSRFINCQVSEAITVNGALYFTDALLFNPANFYQFVILDPVYFPVSKKRILDGHVGEPACPPETDPV